MSANKAILNNSERRYTANRINRIVRLLEATLVIMVLIMVLQSAAGVLGYAAGVMIALAVAVAQLFMGRFIDKFKKAKWALWLPTLTAASAPVVYVLYKVVFSGSLFSAAVKLILPVFFGTLLPLILLMIAIYMLKNTAREL